MVNDVLLIESVLALSHAESTAWKEGHVGTSGHRRRQAKGKDVIDSFDTAMIEILRRAAEERQRLKGARHFMRLSVPV